MQEKNQLAYERGQLQARIQQLQTQVQEMCNSQSELGQLQRAHQNLISQHSKVKVFPPINLQYMLQTWVHHMGALCLDYH